MEFSFEELQRRRVANIQSQFTNAEDLQKAEQEDLEKARHGTYEDNAYNRKLNRVGQEYGHKAEEKQPSGQHTKKTEETSGAGGKTVADYAADTDSGVLQKVVDDPNAKPELKEAAQAELKKRGEGESKKQMSREETNKDKKENKHNNIFDEYTTDVDVSDEMVKKFEEMDNDEEIAELPGVIDGIGYHIADYDIDINELENEGYSEGDEIWDQLMKEKLLDEVSEYNEKISSAVKKYGVKAVKKYIKENSETIKNSELDAIINQALKSSKK